MRKSGNGEGQGGRGSNTHAVAPVWSVCPQGLCVGRVASEEGRPLGGGPSGRGLGPWRQPLERG